MLRPLDMSGVSMIGFRLGSAFGTGKGIRRCINIVCTVTRHGLARLTRLPAFCLVQQYKWAPLRVDQRCPCGRTAWNRVGTSRDSGDDRPITA